jgi:hypothetical protein
MKFLTKYYLAFLFLLPVVGVATITAEKEYALNRMNATSMKYALGTELAKKPNIVVGKYSFGVTGQTATSGDVNLLRSLTDSTSTITIPDNAIVTNVFVDVLTAPVGASTAITLVNTADLLASTPAGSFTAGRYLGIPDSATVADYIKLAADKTLKATLTGTASAGKWNVYVEYVLGD